MDERDEVVFWAVTIAIVLLLAWAILRDEGRGEFCHPCLPDGTCKMPTLVCREGRERGDWRCLPPRGEQ
jgi:hypothetical protein